MCASEEKNRFPIFCIIRDPYFAAMHASESGCLKGTAHIRRTGF